MAAIVLPVHGRPKRGEVTTYSVIPSEAAQGAA
jgi:hypothetical protein